MKTIVFEGLPPEVEWEEFPDGAIGYYRPEYAAEWKKVLGKDGKWAGLKMEMAMELPK